MLHPKQQVGQLDGLHCLEHRSQFGGKDHGACQVGSRSSVQVGHDDAPHLWQLKLRGRQPKHSEHATLGEWHCVTGMLHPPWVPLVGGPWQRQGALQSSGDVDAYGSISTGVRLEVRRLGTGRDHPSHGGL